MSINDLPLFSDMEILISLLLFCVITSITPGPNNIMLLTSGVNFGFKRTITHSIGIIIGFLIMLIVVGLGMGSILMAFPNLSLIFKILGSLYLLYLSYRISLSRVIGRYDQNKDRPLKFLEAVIFQWANPKGWTMAISVITVYGDIDAYFISLIFIALIFAIIMWPCILVWAISGNSFRKYLNTSNKLKWFNISVAIMLVLSIVPMLIMEF